MAWPRTELVPYVLASTPGTAFSSTDRTGIVIGVGFIAAVMLMGGSPRPEVASLPLLRGLAVVFAAFGLSRLTRRQLQPMSHIMLLAAAFLFALPWAQLMPLPPGLVASLPGREILGEIDQAIGQPRIWRPLTMSPLGTANAVLAGIVPFAALIIAITTPRSHQGYLAIGFLGAGFVSLCLGLGQILSPPDSVLYFFETSNEDSPVGLFANRNHQAVFLGCMTLLVPIAIPIGSDNGRPWELWLRTACLFVVCLWLSSMALLTGSRAGALVTSVALICVPMIVGAQIRAAQPPRISNWRDNVLRRSLALVISLLLIFPFAMALDRAPALDRLLGTDTENEARLKILPQVIDLTWLYWPWGSGAGSFEKVFQLHEPDDLLGPAYMNHAHNDILEVVLTGGAAGLAFLVCGAVLWLTLAFRVIVVDRSDKFQPLRKAGLIITALLIVASSVDYPLRTPSLASLFVFASTWAALPYRASLAR